MCGIVGVINSKKENRNIAKEIFKTCMVLNEERGKDSTGVLAIDNETKEFSLFKGLLPSSVFMTRKKFRQVEGDVWIGHTRLATTGDITERNAHPLNRKDVFLSHNGMINNHTALGIKEGLEYQVDSEVLIPAVADEDWELLQKVKGSANFIAWNKEKERIYVERHDNPLYCLSLKELQILAFSSVEDPLKILCVHYGGSVKDDLFEFPDDYMEILNMQGQRVEDPVHLKFPPSYEYTGTNYGNWDKDKNKRQLTYNSKDYERCDYGSEDWDDCERYSRYYQYEDINCEVCQCDIEEDESMVANASWGYPLCYRCKAELDEIEKAIRDGDTIDLESPIYDKYRDILEVWIDADNTLGEGLLNI